VRRQLEALNRADFSEALGRFASSVEWWDRADELNPTVHRGHDGVGAMLADFAEHFAKLQIEATEFIVLGDCVVVPVHLVARGRASGVPIEEDEVHVYRLDDGKITEVREYNTKSEALEALALEGYVY